MTTELRYITGQEVRMEPAKDGKPAKIVGYAAVYNSLSQDLGNFRETITPGAFTAALASAPDVRGRYNHEGLLGRTKSGTLRLADDARGLRYEIDVADTTLGRDVAESVRRGDVDGSSFAFRVRGSDGEVWKRDAAGGVIRELRALELFDVGPVDNPAYLGTEGSLSIRSLPAASQRAAAVAARETPGTPATLALARLRLAEVGEQRFYVPSKELDAACADACRQAANACDSVISLWYKLEGMDAAGQACTDCVSIAQAAADILAGSADSAIAPDVCQLAAKVFRVCAATCTAVDHPTTKLCALVCSQAADQCATLFAGTGTNDIQAAAVSA
jgi:HK97 family phage prohead protease